MKLVDCKNILVSISGGRTSAYLAYKIKNDPMLQEHNIVYVFADTGKERRETIDFLRLVDTRFSLGVIAVRAVVSLTPRVGTQYEVYDLHAPYSHDTSPFEAMVRKYGLPNQSRPHCTRTLKIEPINRFAKYFFKGQPYVTAVGIRADELKRVKGAGAFNKVYPLVNEYPTRIDTIDAFFAQPGAPQLALKSWEGNCDFCWKKSDIKLGRIAQDNPAVVHWWRNMEEQHGGEVGYTFFRNNRTVDDVLFDAATLDLALLDKNQPLDLSIGGHIGASCDCE